MDLVNVPKEKVTYIGVYGDGSVAYFKSPDDMYHCLTFPDYAETLKVTLRDKKFHKVEVFDLEAYHA